MSPTTQEPLISEPQTPKNAPMSIMPSRPMFTTPERSEKMPPMAAKASGVAKRNVAPSSPAVRMSFSVSTSFVWTQTAPSVPAMPSTIAAQPSLRSPRGTTAIPQASATKPAAIGPARSRSVHGGSASQNATSPLITPMTPIVRGDVSVRSQSAEANVSVGPVVIPRLRPAPSLRRARAASSAGTGATCAPPRYRRSAALLRRRR
jgi:hypothetical protein